MGEKGYQLTVSVVVRHARRNQGAKMPRQVPVMVPSVVRRGAQRSEVDSRTIEVRLPVDVIHRLEAVDQDLSAAVMQLVKAHESSAVAPGQRRR